MITVARAFALFTLERVRSALLALAAIILVKAAAIGLFAPILDQIAPGPNPATASSFVQN